MAYNILYDCASTDEKALAFLQRNLLIRSRSRSTPPECPEVGCENLMTLVKTGRGEDRCFRCPSHKGQKVFLCTDTFSENSKLSYRNIVELIFSWSFKTPVNLVFSLDLMKEQLCSGFPFF